MQIIQSRRHFLASASLATAGGLLGARGSLADDGPPETTTIRLPRIFAICLAPGYIADGLLRAEGFSDVRYIDAPVGLSVPQMVGRGDIDFGITAAPMVAFVLDAGLRITALSGIHSGCYELFAHDPIQGVSDLKGKRVGLHSLSSAAHLNMTVMTSYIGLDPHKDIQWLQSPTGDAMELFAEGQVDAFLGFPPEPQELRARRVGRVILNTTTDKPWSDYSAAWCLATGSSCAIIRLLPSASCAPS
jgi:NitT/TauT family transport system substrate-binding protein